MWLFTSALYIFTFLSWYHGHYFPQWFLNQLTFNIFLILFSSISSNKPNTFIRHDRFTLRFMVYWVCLESKVLSICLFSPSSSSFPRLLWNIEKFGARYFIDHHTPNTIRFRDSVPVHKMHDCYAKISSTAWHVRQPMANAIDGKSIAHLLTENLYVIEVSKHSYSYIERWLIHRNDR